MNRITSSSSAQKKKFPQSQSQSQQPPAKKRNIERERFPANPLRGFSSRGSGSSCCSNVSSSGTSGEASSGCDRSLFSHSFSSSSSLGVFPHGMKSVAPKSTPDVSKPLIRKKPRSLEETKLKSTLTGKPHLHKSQRCKTNLTSGNRPICKSTMKPEKGSVLKKQSSVSRDIKLKDSQTTITVDESIAQITPVTKKLGTISGLINRNKGEVTDDGRLSNNSSSYQDRTPPVQASVSPEIQCGSSMNLYASSQSQACYATGHLLSGVSDKRKCKPKGILTVEKGFEVGNGKILNNSDEFVEGDFGYGGSCNDISVMLLPANASVHWLLSPCDEQKEKLDHGFSQLHKIVECVGHETPSPLSDGSASSDVCNISSDISLSLMNVCKEAIRRTSSSLSPNELSRFKRFIHLSSCDCEASPVDTTPTCELDPSENLKGDNPSPLSIDTLGSGNVIQTPESNSSFENYFGSSYSRAEIHKELLLIQIWNH